MFIKGVSSKTAYGVISTEVPLGTKRRNLLKEIKMTLYDEISPLGRFASSVEMTT